jgi:hypothetical protein
MITINRTSRRRVGKFTVSITPEGIEIRKFRGKSPARAITWEELVKVIGADAPRSRAEAFARRPEPGWVPVVGDVVYLPHSYRRSRGRVVNVIPAVPEPMFTVLVGEHQFILERDNLRPCRERAKLLTDDEKRQQSFA